MRVQILAMAFSTLLLVGCSNKTEEQPPPFVLNQLEINGEKIDIDNPSFTLRPGRAEIKGVLEDMRGELIGTCVLNIMEGRDMGESAKLSSLNGCASQMTPKGVLWIIETSLEVPEFQGEVTLNFVFLPTNSEPPLPINIPTAITSN
jgi:hypothetical protein